MTPIQTIYTYLQTAGLLGTWTGPGGSTQPAPIVQMRLLEEEKAPASERILLIKSVSPGGGNRFVSDPVFVFAIMGKVGEPPVFAEAYAELLYQALLEFDHADCIVNIDPLGRIGGAYKMDSGRVVYDMEWSVSVDSGKIL
jgi:hypothetical protein